MEEKGFSVSSIENRTDENDNAIQHDSAFITKPSTVLLTGNPQVRLTTLYKVNYDKKTREGFIGSNSFHYNYNEEAYAWNNHIMPGFEALYGYNLVNISHFDTESKQSHTLFEKPVLIKTFYYPSFETDSLNNKPVERSYFLLSVYDEDTNKDGYINTKDLRRFYHVDINGKTFTSLIPSDYSVFKSEYDSGNDFMYLFAQQDSNQNGKHDPQEPIHIFLVDLKMPSHSIRLY